MSVVIFANLLFFRDSQASRHGPFSGWSGDFWKGYSSLFWGEQHDVHRGACACYTWSKGLQGWWTSCVQTRPLNDLSWGSQCYCFSAIKCLYAEYSFFMVMPQFIMCMWAALSSENRFDLSEILGRMAASYKKVILLTLKQTQVVHPCCLLFLELREKHLPVSV